MYDEILSSVQHNKPNVHLLRSQNSKVCITKNYNCVNSCWLPSLDYICVKTQLWRFGGLQLSCLTAFTKHVAISPNDSGIVYNFSLCSVSLLSDLLKMTWFLLFLHSAHFENWRIFCEGFPTVQFINCLEMWSSAKASPAPQSQTKSLGMTAPISNAGPEEKDLELTSQLQETLIPHGCFESEEELNHRMDVLRWE